MKPSFGKRLTASYLFIVAVTLAFTGWLLTPQLQKAFLTQLEQNLAAQAGLIAGTIETNLTKDSQNKAMRYAQATQSRVTMIRADGTVLGDSERTDAEIPKMENHLTRPEVQEALRAGQGQATRYSATLHENMLYVAVPANEGVVRLALPLTEVNRRIAAIQKDLLKAGAAALLVAWGVAVISVRRISHPLHELVTLAGKIGSGQRPNIPNVDGRDEFGRLAKAFDEMTRRIEEKVSELTRERTQLGAILSSLVESIVALDHQGRIIFLNPAAERLFGIASTEAKGRPFLEVLRHSPLNEVLTQTLADRKPVQKEIILHSPVERVISANALPVNYGEGQTGVLAALHDITDLRKLENLRREFVANVSHELKTPLTSIKGYIETLLDGAMNDPKHNRPFLETIQEHTNNLSRLIDDVLDLSAIEAQRINYRFEPVQLNEVVDRIINALEPMAKAKHISIRSEISKESPKIYADREKLAQIIMNLIDNALKFNKAGGDVRITTAIDEKYLRVDITDTGRGIAPEDLPRIFERFYRGNKDRSHEIPGTGLGLAIVKHLIDAHHGTVNVQSALGQGSTFRILLPLA